MILRLTKKASKIFLEKYLKKRFEKILIKSIRAITNPPWFGYLAEDKDVLSKDRAKSPSIFITLLISRILTESAQKFKVYELETLIQECQAVIKGFASTSHYPSLAWNYFGNESGAIDTSGTENTKNSLPYDLDDTFNAIYTLLYRPDISINQTELDERATLILSVVRHLLKTQHKLSKTRSAYNTWVVDDFTAGRFFDIDPVVQIIIYKTLKEIKSVPKDFENFLNASLSKLSKSRAFWDSKYYANKLYILSEISSLPLQKAKLYSKKILCKFLSDTKSSTKNNANSLDQILLYQCHINMGETISFKELVKILFLNRRIIHLVQHSSSSNLTSVGPIYTDKITSSGKTEVYSGSVMLALYIRLICHILSNLTSNFLAVGCLATSALGGLDKLNTLQPDSSKINIKSIKSSIYKDVKSRLDQTIKQFTHPEKFLALIFKKNDQIKNIIDELFAWYQSLKRSTWIERWFSSKDYTLLTQTSLTTSYAWVAYTTYDSIIDREISNRFIPIANICLHCMDESLADCVYKNRSNTKCKYFKSMSTDRLWTIINQILGETNKGLFKDARLSYNINYPRSARYFTRSTPENSSLSSSLDNPCKSIGHCIGPILLFKHLQPTITSEQIKHFVLFYKNLLSAKQLSDDAHDWEIDMGFEKKVKPNNKTDYIKLKELKAQTRYTPVTKMIMDEISKSQPCNFEHKINIDELRKIFVKIALPKILEQMDKYSKEAELELNFLNKFLTKDKRIYWIKKVHKYEEGVIQALTEALALEKMNLD